MDFTNLLKKATTAHLLMGLGVLVAILLLWGILKLAFQISLGPLADQIIPNAVIVGAVVIFAWNRWLLGEKQKERDAEAQRNKNQPTGGSST